MRWLAMLLTDRRVVRWALLIVSAWVVCFPVLTSAQKKIEFYATPTVSLEPDTVLAYAVQFRDTLAGDTLYQVRSAGGIPVSYYRKIHTSVCFDNKCRLLNAIVHWNITGRYLGIELPPGEFLSKKEHEPFTADEYRHLHALLSDANSPLGGFSYNELVPRQTAPSEEIDAVSSPTAKHLLEYVVEGAAFTTYKLWHIVYGTTREEVSALTAAQISRMLLVQILHSPVMADKLWGLNHRKLVQGSSPVLRAQLLDLALSPEYNLAERAINAIDSSDLRFGNFQSQWVSRIQAMNHSLQKPAILKMREAPRLDPAVGVMLAEKLSTLSGDLVGTVLDVLAGHALYNPEICSKVADLLSNPNYFISRQAFDFLTGIRIQDSSIRKKMENFRKEHGLD